MRLVAGETMFLSRVVVQAVMSANIITAMAVLMILKGICIASAPTVPKAKAETN